MNKSNTNVKTDTDPYWTAIETMIINVIMGYILKSKKLKNKERNCGTFMKILKELKGGASLSTYLPQPKMLLDEGCNFIITEEKDSICSEKTYESIIATLIIDLTVFNNPKYSQTPFPDKFSESVTGKELRQFAHNMCI